MAIRRITRIAVVKASAIAAIIYAIFGLLLAPVFAVVEALQGGLILVWLIGLPVAYGILGFVATAVIVGLFNLIAPKLGGVDVQVE